MTVPAAMQTVPGSAQTLRSSDPGLLGRPLHWARDFALVGAVTGGLAPLAVYSGFPSAYYLLTGVGGMLAGALLGGVLPRLLGARIRRLPVAALLVVGPALGALWGALAGLAGSLVFRDSAMDLGTLSVMAGAAAGAVQFGWLWIPYSVKRARKKRVWPVVAGALALAPAMGWAAMAVLDFIY